MKPLLIAVTLFMAVPGSAQENRKITISEALQSTRENNITWRSLGEYLTQAQAGVDIGIGMFLPKVGAEATWIHMGERHTPDMSGLTDMGLVLGELIGSVIEEHSNQADRFAPYMAMMTGGEGGDTFSNFIPPSDTISGTFSLAVPVFNPETIPMLQGAYDRQDAAVQQVGYGREQLLYAVARAYYGLCTLQTMIQVSERSIESAEEHHKSSQVRAGLQAATQLEVKRAELEVNQNQSRKVELAAGLEKAKAGFSYLTGLKGAFEFTEPVLDLAPGDKPLTHWQELAARQRKDLLAARIEVLVSEHEVTRVKAKYLPSLNLFGQIKLDNAESQRFDDDPASWTIGATMSLNIWDGGIREAELDLANSRLRQAQMAHEDLQLKIESDVAAAYQALKDATAARKLAEHQLEVAKDTQELAEAAEKAGAATNLEVIDANTMVFASEAQFQGAKLNQAVAVLDLLSVCGSPVPF